MLERPPGPFQVNKSHPAYGRLGLLVAPQGDNFTNLLIPGQMGVKAAGTSLSTATVPILGQSLKSAGGAASGVKFPTGISTTTINSSGAIFACLQFTDATSQSVFFSTATTATGWRFEVQSGNLNNTAQGVSAVSSTGLSLTTGIPYFVACSWDGGGQNWIVRNLASGNTVTATSASVPGASGGDQTFVVGGRISASTGFNGYISLLGFLTASGSASDQGSKILARALANDPWAIIRPDGYRRIYFTSAPAGGAVNTAVTLSPASFTYTPASLSAKTNRLVSLTGPSFTYTPNSLTAVTSRKAVLSPVSYSYSVNSLSAVTGRKVTLSPTSFAYTPNSLTTQLTRKVALSPVSWSWTINDLTAVFVGKTAYVVDLSPVAFSFTPRSIEALYSSPQTNVSRGKTGKGSGPFRGPYDLSKRRWGLRPTKREEDEASKALVEAQQALEAAQEATRAKARQEAIAKVFRALEAVGAEQEVTEAKAALAEAQSIKAANEKRAAIEMELSELQRFITEAVEEMEAMRRKRRQEEEDFIMRLLLN